MIPKIESLVASLDELEADVACITETWLTGEHEKICQDVCDRTDYGLIIKNRTERKGGGVGIIYNKSHLTMTQCKLPASDYEIVAAIGRRTRQRRKVLAIAAYLPPKYSAEENKNFLSYLCDAILTLKHKYSDPYVIVAGDFNKRNLSEATKDYQDIKQVKTPPTRGTAVLDIIATNMTDNLIEAGVTDPV